MSKPGEDIAFFPDSERDLLLAYPIVHTEALDELLAVAAQHQAHITADCAEEVAVIAAVHQRQTRCTLSVAIKVYVGLHRVGVYPYHDAAIALAQQW